MEILIYGTARITCSKKITIIHPNIGKQHSLFTSTQCLSLSSAIHDHFTSMKGGYWHYILISFFRLGFAPDQFNFQDPTAGNLIFFKSDKHQVSCHITPTDVSEKRIGCETEWVSSNCRIEVLRFPNCRLPLCQNEASSEPVHMKICSTYVSCKPNSFTWKVLATTRFETEPKATLKWSIYLRCFISLLLPVPLRHLMVGTMN